jgi:hypothetical protein
MNTLNALKSNQSGFSLPIALILLVPLTLLAVTVAKRSSLEESMAGAQKDGAQAMMNADSGLRLADHIFDEIVAGTHAYEISDYLDALGQGGVLKYKGTDALTNYSLDEGTVTVTIRDNDDGDSDPYTDSDNRVVVRSVGLYQGAERIVEGIFSLSVAPPPAAKDLPPLTIFAEEYVSISGNPDIFGPGSLVHSNSYVNIGGTVRIAGEIQQVGSGGSGNYQQGTYDGGWSDLTSVQVTKNVAALDTPYVYPPVYKPFATRYMAANCKIWDGMPNSTSPVTGDASKIVADAYGNEVDGWVCDNDGSRNKKWELLNDTSAHFYYVEGNMYINGNPGEGGDPICLSIVAEGFIEVSGNPNIEPYYVCSGENLDCANTKSQEQVNLITSDYNGHLAADIRAAVLCSEEVLLLAGGDMKINGNPSQNFNGVMAAHQEFQISGEPRLEGAVIAENSTYSAHSAFQGRIDSGERKSDLVTFNEINGNPDIWGSSDLGGGGPIGESTPTGVTLDAWREVVEQ